MKLVPITTLRNLGNIRNLIWLTAFWLLAFDAMFLVPSFTNEHTIMPTLTSRDYVIFIATSFLLALLMVLEIEIRRMRGGGGWRRSFLGGAGVFSAMVSAIFGTASCALCLGVLFNLLGFGTSFFLSRNSLWFGALAILFLLTALGFSLRRFNTTCEECRVAP
jgi:hypothetical protein